MSYIYALRSTRDSRVCKIGHTNTTVESRLRYFNKSTSVKYRKYAPFKIELKHRVKDTSDTKLWNAGFAGSLESLWHFYFANRKIFKGTAVELFYANEHEINSFLKIDDRSLAYLIFFYSIKKSFKPPLFTKSELYKTFNANLIEFIPNKLLAPQLYTEVISFVENKTVLVRWIIYMHILGKNREYTEKIIKMSKWCYNNRITKIVDEYTFRLGAVI